MTSQEERQPLLGERRAAGKSRWAQVVDSLQAEWPLIRTLLVATTFFLFYYGKQGFEMTATRDLACAAYYGLHPDEVQTITFEGGNTKACSPSSVESFTAQVTFVADILSTSIGSMAVIFYGSKLSKWGRRPVLMIGILSETLISFALAMLPKFYPFGPTAQAASGFWRLGPLLSLATLFAMTVFYAMLGTELVVISAIRVLVTDASSAAVRTRNYLFLTISILVGLTFGPLLLSLCAEVFPISRTSFLASLDWRRHGSETPRQPPYSPRPPTDQIPAPVLTEHNNVTALLVAIAGMTATILAVAFLLPETAPPNAEAQSNDDDQKTKPSNISPLSIILPRRRPSDGLLDWRITRVALTEALANTSIVGLSTLAQYGSYRLGWTGENISLLVSIVGVGRGSALAIVVPAIFYVLERYTRKPAGLRHMTTDEIKRIAKSTPAETAPEGDDDEDADELHHLKGLVSLWKARVDLALAKFSYLLDSLVWLFISLATSQFLSTTALYTGIFLLQMGAGAQAALHSVGVTVTVDALGYTTPLLSSSSSSSESAARMPGPMPEQDLNATAGGEAEREEAFHKRATAAFFALISLVDGLTMTLSKILTTAVYVETLDSVPWLPFFLFAIFQAAALHCVSTIQVHR